MFPLPFGPEPKQALKSSHHFLVKHSEVALPKSFADIHL